MWVQNNMSQRYNSSKRTENRDRVTHSSNIASPSGDDTMLAPKTWLSQRDGNPRVVVVPR